MSVHIKIALTDEQMKAIDTAVNDYINNYEGLVERIKEIIGVRLGLKEDDFKCEVGSCVGDAVLPEGTPETAESDLETRISEALGEQAENDKKSKYFLINVQGLHPQTGEKPISPMYNRITKDNVDEIFSYDLSDKYWQGIYGTKAVVYKDTKGKYHVAFMTEMEATHHRHALAALVEKYDPQYAGMAKAIYDGNYEIGAPLLYQSMGFEFQYDKHNGNIIGIKQDSWITKRQREHGIIIPQIMIEDMIIEMLSRIDQDMLNDEYKDLRWIEDEKLSEDIMPSWLFASSGRYSVGESVLEFPTKVKIPETQTEAEQPLFIRIENGIITLNKGEWSEQIQINIGGIFIDEQVQAAEAAIKEIYAEYTNKQTFLEQVQQKLKELGVNHKIDCKTGSINCGTIGTPVNAEDTFEGDVEKAVTNTVKILSETAPETAKSKKEITTIVIETIKKSAGPKYVQPNTISKSNTQDKAIKPSGLYTFCLDNKYKCGGIAGIFGIALILLIMLVTYGIADYIFKKGNTKTKGDNIQETENEDKGIDYSTLPDPSDTPEETQEVPMSEEEEFDYYFNCFENTPEDFADEGESISGDVYTPSSYLPTMVFTDGYLAQRTKICSGRVDNYLKYLSSKGFGDFLDSNLKIYSMLDDNQKGYLIEGLFRLGNGDAALVLLSFPLPDKEHVYGTYDANYFVFDYTQKIIDKGELDKETALEYYTPLYYDNPNGKGFRFILDNLSPDKRKAFIKELVMSDDPLIKKQFIEYKDQYNTDYNLPKDLLEEIYTQTTDPLLKASLLDKMGIKELPTKLMKELDVLYETSDSGTKKDMVKMMADLANSDQTDEAESDPYNVFISDKFKESSDANDLVVLGDVLDYNQLLGLYKKDPNFNKYLIAKAKQSGNNDEPFKFYFREFIDSCVSDVECIVNIKTEEVWCSKGC